MPSTAGNVLLALTLAVALVVIGGIWLTDSPGDPGEGQLGDGNAPDPGASDLNVVNGSFPGWVHETGTLDVSVAIANEGGDDERETVDLVVDSDGDGTIDRTVAQKEVTVPAGDTIQVRFAVDAPSSGDYEFGVVAGGGSETAWSVDVLEPPQMSISGVDSTIEVVKGDRASVSAVVANDGGFATRTVEFRMTAEEGARLDEPITGAESVRLQDGETTTVSFPVPTEDISPGTYSYEVQMDGTTTAGTLQVLAPAAFEISSVTTAVNVTRGSTASITAEVANTGGVSDTRTIAFVAPDGETDTRQIDLGAGTSTTLEFSVDTDDLAAGRYDYSITTGDDRASSADDGSIVPALQVREGRIVVEAVRGNESIYVGEELALSAVVSNAGNATVTQTADLLIDTDGDGTPDSSAAAESVTLAPGENATVTLQVPYMEQPGLLGSSAMPPTGTYAYEVRTDDSAATGPQGELNVSHQPATFELGGIDASANVTRGTPATIRTTVTNTGDLGGTQNVTVSGSTLDTVAQAVTLEPGESANVSLDVATADLDSGTYEYTVATADDAVTATGSVENGSAPLLQVRDSDFVVTDLRGNETLYVGDRMTFAADIVNVGDAADTQTIELKIDITDDNEPGSHGLTKNVTLQPGERTSVRFWVPYMEDPDPLDQVENLPTGAYIYGIYSEDSEKTGVFEAKMEPVDWNSVVDSGSDDSGTDGSGDSSGEETQDLVSLDEITQERYGVYYDELSGDTKSQIEEIYERQPFTGNLGVTDVMTREEIAKYEYGYDLDLGNDFSLSQLDSETVQQQIEADYDAQFTTETGDSIESWEELAQAQYGTSFENLSDTEQQQIKGAYREQFE